MHADFLAVFEAMGSDSAEFLAAMKSSLLSMNGETHKTYRALVAPLFTPRAVESVRPLAWTEAHMHIDEFPDRGTIEFIGAFASPYVTAITGSFLGLAATRWTPASTMSICLGRGVKTQESVSRTSSAAWLASLDIHVPFWTVEGRIDRTT